MMTPKKLNQESVIKLFYNNISYCMINPYEEFIQANIFEFLSKFTTTWTLTVQVKHKRKQTKQRTEPTCGN